MRDAYIIAIMAVLGLIIGLSVFYLANNGGESDEQSQYCDEVEQRIKANQSFNGTLACYPPGVLDVNESEQVVDQTELQCVCRRTYNGNEQLFTIRKSR